jgi:hypothetical protein
MKMITKKIRLKRYMSAMLLLIVTAQANEPLVTTVGFPNNAD